MRILPASYSDELDVEVESPEAIIELEKGNFSRLYPVLREYRKLKEDGTKGKRSLVKKIGSAIGKKRKDGAAGKNPDFRRINLVFPEKSALEDWETHSRLDGIKEKFREYCTIERKKEEKTANRLNLLKDCMILGVTAATLGLGTLAYAGYLVVVKSTPLLISAADELGIFTAYGVRTREMKHREKIGDIEMVDDAKLNFLTPDGYGALLEKRQNAPPKLPATPNQRDVPNEKAGKEEAPTTTLELDCREFLDTELLIERVMEKCGTRTERSEKSLYLRLKDYVGKKLSRKKTESDATAADAEKNNRLSIALYVEGECDKYVHLQKEFREKCRKERMEAEKAASLYEKVKSSITIGGSITTKGSLGVASYLGLIPLAHYPPLLIETAADLIVLSGVIPRHAEMGQRKKAKLLEELEAAELKVVPSGGYCNNMECPRKGFYSPLPVQA